ncbi:hypothetical protein [Sphingobium algorifonticola]
MLSVTDALSCSGSVGMCEDAAASGTGGVADAALIAGIAAAGRSGKAAPS